MLIPAAVIPAGDDCFEKLKSQYSSCKMMSIEAELEIYSRVFEDSEKYKVKVLTAENGYYNISVDKDMYLFDGTKIWEYSFDNNQATYRVVSSEEQPTDQISFIKNLGTFYYTADADPCRSYRLVLIDSSETSLPDELKILLKKGGLAEIEYYDLNGDLNTFHVQSVKLYDEFKQALFEPDFPDSTDIISLP